MPRSTYSPPSISKAAADAAYAPVTGSTAYVHVPTSGVASARPSATGIGQTYYATDTGVTSISLDGSTWKTLGSGGVVNIQKIVVGGSPSASIDFTGLDLSAYSKIVIDGFARTNLAANPNEDVHVYFNADTTETHYSRESVFAAAGSASAAEVKKAANSTLVWSVTAATADANRFTDMELVVAKPANTLADKIAQIRYSRYYSTTMSETMGVLFWLPATPAAITEITFTPASGGSFITGSELTLRGFLAL